MGRRQSVTLQRFLPIAKLTQSFQKWRKCRGKLIEWCREKTVGKPALKISFTGVLKVCLNEDNTLLDLSADSNLTFPSQLDRTTLAMIPLILDIGRPTCSSSKRGRFRCCCYLEIVRSIVKTPKTLEISGKKNRFWHDDSRVAWET